VIFIAIFIKMYLTNFREIVNICRLSTSDFTDEKLCT